MRNRDKYYILWFKPFKNKSVEQIALLPGGYRYLLKLLKDIKSDTVVLNRPRLEMMIREVLRRGDSLPVKAKCHCGKNMATNFATLIDDRGYYSFGQIFCSECREDIPPDKPYPLDLRLSSLLMIPMGNKAQARALRIFKHCYFLDENEKITKRTAQRLFFPELYMEAKTDGTRPPGRSNRQANRQGRLVRGNKRGKR